jgi:hypothetical protein
LAARRDQLLDRRAGHAGVGGHLHSHLAAGVEAHGTKLPEHLHRRSHIWRACDLHQHADLLRRADDYLRDLFRGLCGVQHAVLCGHVGELLHVVDIEAATGLLLEVLRHHGVLQHAREPVAGGCGQAAPARGHVGAAVHVRQARRLHCRRAQVEVVHRVQVVDDVLSRVTHAAELTKGQPAQHTDGAADACPAHTADPRAESRAHAATQISATGGRSQVPKCAGRCGGQRCVLITRGLPDGLRVLEGRLEVRVWRSR